MKYKKYFLQDVYDASKQEKFTYISTFAGGGGSTTGYKLAGGKCLGFNEFVEEAVETYLQNYPGTPCLPGDIKSYKGEDFLKLANIIPGELDIFDTSPPCSAFSVAGKGKKGWDKEKNYSDGKKVQNIENLFLEAIRIIKDLQPKIIIAENVAGLTIGTNREKLNEFTQGFESTNYVVAHDVINAAHFGTPQARQRTIFVGIRKDIAELLEINNFNILDVFPIGNTRDFVSLKEAIDDVQNDKAEVQELLDYVQGGFQKKWIPLLPHNPDRHVKASEFHPNKSLFNMIRPCPDLPCPTITQRGQQKSVSGVFHYSQDRKLTILELKRIMGLPEDYILTGNFDKKAERICRMHAPLAVKAIADSVYETILQPYKEKLKCQKS